MIDKLGLDGLGGASVRVEPTPQEQKVTPPVDGQSKSAFTPSDGDTPAVVGLEPVHWYLENEDEYMSEKLRKEHERLNSYTFKLCKVAHPLYSAADVAKLQAEITRLGGVCSDYRKTQETMFGDLAASQAREQQLREALETIKRCSPDGDWPDEFNALALPQDDTALRQQNAKLLRDLVYNRLEGLCNESGMNELLRKADELEAGK